MDVARVIGLTGGIACGKSTVAGMLNALGVPVVDADELARRVVEPGTPALAEIVERFGLGVLDDDGRLHRKRLGAIVFADSDARLALERITHPRIAQAGRDEIARHIAGGASVVVYEAALIVENNLHKAMNALIVVSVSADVQRRRLMARDGIDEAAAQRRIDAQLPLADKIAVADHVVDNSGTIEQTRARVHELWREIA